MTQESKERKHSSTLALRLFRSLPRLSNKMDPQRGQMHVGPEKRLARRLAASGAKGIWDTAFAEYLTERDPLGRLRHHFSLPTKEAVWPELYAKYHGPVTAEDLQPAVYLAGNSLGLMPLSTPGYIQQEFDVWSKS